MSWLGDIASSLIGGWFQSREANKQRDWNAEQAELNRQFQSDEAAINREFQSSEAALQRSWSAAQAERAMDWNEEMYAKYNSLSGKIAQANDAGVNPMVAITGNAVSPMSTGASAPSGSSAGSVGTPSGATATSQFVDLVATFMGLRKLKSEVAVNESIADKNLADAGKTTAETAWVDKLSQAQLDNLVADTDELSSRLGLNSAQADKLKAEFGKLVQETAKISQITDSEVRRSKAEATLAEWQRDNKELLVGLDVGADVLSAVTQIATTYMEGKTKLILGGKK